MTGKSWTWAAIQEAPAVLYYVESNANISDAPLRERSGPLTELGATCMPAVLPPSADHIWEDP